MPIYQPTMELFEERKVIEVGDRKYLLQSDGAKTVVIGLGYVGTKARGRPIDGVYHVHIDDAFVQRKDKESLEEITSSLEYPKISWSDCLRATDDWQS